MPVLIRIKNLKKHFPIRSGFLLRETAKCFAIDGVDLELESGQTLGLVGESGCGKSTLGRTIARIYEPTEGEVLFEGENIARLRGEKLKSYRQNVQMIFQDPYSSLNPRQTIGNILEMPFRVYGRGTPAERKKWVKALLEHVRLGAWAVGRYPHEFSGGQRQRIAIARAIALRPKLIIADEPVSALDVSVQSQILNLLKDLQKEMKLAYLFVAHDLAVVKHISNTIAVMYLGKVMEYATKEKLFANPLHPYTMGLLAANPTMGGGKRHKRGLLKGDIPSPITPPSGCVFHTRCPYAEPRCKEVVPLLQDVDGSVTDGSNHQVACHYYKEIKSGAKKHAN